MAITLNEVRVENHQPVPLVPLAELPYDSGAPVYLGKIVSRGGSVYPGKGWLMWDDSLNDFINLESLGDGQANENLDSIDLDEDLSLGRMLQPGEKLVVEFESL